MTTTSTMTSPKQALFNTSFKHILTQGEPSINMGDGKNGTCAYRHPEGRSCGAAPFITKYDPKMEGTSFFAVAHKVKAGMIDGAITDEAAAFPDFVTDLQRAHDSAAQQLIYESGGGMQETINYTGASFRERYLKNMINLAAMNGLTIPLVRV